MGYTKVGDEFREVDGVHAFLFAGHNEKPPLEVAKKYLDDGSYFWHANYYMWTPRAFVESFEKYAPKMGKTLREIQTAVKEGNSERVAELYGQLEKISIDYAVTEKMNPEDVLILRGDFGWSDIGAWDTLYDRLSESGENVTKGNTVAIETKGSLIYGVGDKLVTVVGMQDVIIVDTGDALLVCHKDHAQKVKDIVQHLKENGKEHYL
jgi:mannose-1-phosphate guanylyltransferase